MKNLEIQKNDQNLGVWTEKENVQYVVFLQKNRNKFACRLKQRYHSQHLGKLGYFSKCLSLLVLDQQFNVEHITKNIKIS
jgi:hypothetical protein